MMCLFFYCVGWFCRLLSCVLLVVTARGTEHDLRERRAMVLRAASYWIGGEVAFVAATLSAAILK